MAGHAILQHQEDAKRCQAIHQVSSDMYFYMKYYQIKPDVIFRNYGDFGYITDNRNFGYHFSNTSYVLGDRIVSESGAVILSCLKKTPLSIDEIVSEAMKEFDDANENQLKSDVEALLQALADAGFVIIGDSEDECRINACGATRYKVANQSVKDSVSINSSTTTQTFFEERFGDTPFPVSVHIEIVSKCNERCVHCYIPHEYKNQVMDEALFYELMSQCQDLKILHITISGGEPLLHPQIIPFLRKCRECDMSVNILSNLTLLNNEIIDEMKHNPLLGVQTSIYSMNPDIHDAITMSRGSLQKTMDGVISLVECGIPVQISCPIMKTNLDGYKDVKEWAAQYNVSVEYDYTLIGQYNGGDANLRYRLSEEEVERVIVDELTSNANYKSELMKEVAENHNKTQDDYICSVCNSSICVAQNGNVFPCAGWQGYVLGNITESSLADIWYHSSKVDYLRGLKRKDFKECENCQQRDYCTICMVRNFNESLTGNPLEVSKYFCKVAEIKRNLIKIV